MASSGGFTAGAQAAKMDRLGGFGTSVGLLISSLALAAATGLASGKTEVAGLPLVLLVSLLAFYTMALAVVGVGGILLDRDVFRYVEEEIYPTTDEKVGRD